MPTRTRSSAHWQGLDGLRALAVASVVVFHFSPATLPGGFLGVDVFFVISGYLITRLLATEFLRDGRINIGRFYQRRARRLLPALVLVLATVSVAALIWRDQLATVRGGVLLTAVFGANWWLAFDHQSYFVAIGRPSMLQHMWSLGVEEQFYLIWPLIVAATLAAGRRAGARGRLTRRRVVARLSLLAIAMSLASTGLTWGIADRQNVPYGNDGSTLYYATPTHCMGLLLGAALGAWTAANSSRPRERGSDGGDGWMSRLMLLPEVWLDRAADLCGVIALGLLVWILFGVANYSHWLYRGDFLLVAILVVTVIAVATRPPSIVGRALDCRPMRWIGVRSYSIYLWHWPVAVVTRPGLDTTMPLWLDQVLRVSITVALAEVTYRYVETPVRRLGFRGAFDAAAAPLRTQWRRLPPSGSVVGPVALITLVLLGLIVIVIGPAAPRPPAALGAAVGGRHLTLSPPVRTRATDPPATSGVQTGPKSVPLPRLSGFGDSVLLGARRALAQVFPGGTIDAVEGRQPDPILADVRAAARRGTLAPLVVLHVGNNGLIDPSDLQRTLAVLSGERLVLVLTDHLPPSTYSWQKPNNQTINGVVPTFANARVVDWHAIAGEHPGWLYHDDLHLRPNGALAYAKLLATTYREAMSLPTNHPVASRRAD